jgi:heptosyltransferase-2
MSAELEDRDLIVDLHGNARSRILTWRQTARVLRAASHRLLRARWVHARWSAPAPVPHATARYAAALRPLGLEADSTPRMSAGAEAERQADRWLAERGWHARPVAFCPGARHATKRWLESHWVDLHRLVRESGRTVVCFSLERERQGLPRLAEAVAADAGSAWCTEALPVMAALLSHCERAVTCDSGLMHVAAARGTRVVALFGSTSPVLGFAPSGEGHAVLCRDEPCQPCTLHGRARCPKGHFRCMTGWTAADVATSLE